jgi:hypothetical protein
MTYVMFLWMHKSTAFKRTQTMREERLSADSVIVLRVAIVHCERRWNHLKGFRESLARLSSRKPFRYRSDVRLLKDISNSSRRHEAIQRSVALAYSKAKCDTRSIRPKRFFFSITTKTWSSLSVPCQRPYEISNHQESGFSRSTITQHSVKKKRLW